MTQVTVRIAVVLSIMLLAGTASAQYWWAPGGGGGTARGASWPRGEVGGELDFMPDDVLTVWVLSGGMHYRVADSFAIEGQLGFVAWDEELCVAGICRDDDGSGMTNPYFAFHYVQAQGRTRFRVGGGLTAPVADERDTTYGWLARGFRDLWLFIDRFSMVPSFRLEADVGNSAFFGMDAEVGLIFPDSDYDDVEMLFQTGGEFAFHAGAALFGLRLQAFWFVTDDADNDYFQTAFVPFVRVQFGAGFFEGRFLINLDEPLGFAFDDDGVFTVMIKGGADLD